jgi:hypothetical protein
MPLAFEIVRSPHRDAARHRPQGRFAPPGGGLRPSLTMAPHRIPGSVRPGQKNGVRPNKETEMMRYELTRSTA